MYVSYFLSSVLPTLLGIKLKYIEDYIPSVHFLTLLAVTQVCLVCFVTCYIHDEDVPLTTKYESTNTDQDQGM